MSSPPRDEAGNVLPHDDAVNIPADALLMRRIDCNFLVEKTPSDQYRRRLSSAAFSPSSRDRDKNQGMSVDVLELLLQDRVAPRERLAANQEAAVAIRASALRQLGFKVGPDPTINNDKYHACVWGVKQKHKKQIRTSCHCWIVRPEDVDPSFDI